MYEPTTSLSLHRLSRQSLQKRYESDEEDVSESDAGPDLVPSLVGSNRAGTIDSDLSADENSHMDPDSDREEHLLAPFPVVKRPRPVSMDTVKRSSDATFAENTRVFDPEEDMVLEIPLPETPPEIDPNFYLQPAIYVSPNTPPTHNRRSRSSSPSSIFSVENAEIQVAKKITLMEPPTRPTLVFINSLGSRSKGSRARPSHSRTWGNARNRESRIFDGKLEGNLQVPHLADVKPKSPRPEHSTDHGSTHTTPDLTTLHEDSLAVRRGAGTGASATINRVSEIPVLPYFPHHPTSPSDRSRSTQDHAHPAPKKHSGHPADQQNQVSALQHSAQTATATCPPSHHAPPHRTMIQESTSFRTTAVKQYIHTSKRGPIAPLTPSNPNVFSQRSPMMRRMTRKHSAASSIHSISSMRSEVDINIAYAGASQTAVNTNYDSRLVRKGSQRRHARHASSATGSSGSSRGFMGLKLGKRAFNKV
ncbi:hypothetical protein N7507_002325 [Penicillium longicatenatum]|nr:hypothetical protein N7507_002325 [Penicillium longicatenatum]